MKPRNATVCSRVTAAALAMVIILFAGCTAPLFAEEGSPLSRKGERQFGLNFGYGYSFESNRHVRFASVYPYMGWVLSDPLGAGWSRGTLEGIVEGAFSFVHKNQRTYAAGINLLERYNFLTPSASFKPYIQGGFGATHTNLSMHDFGSRFNFVSNAACGINYFFRPGEAFSCEWRFFHVSNAGLDGDNAGLNMNNVFIGYSRTF